MAASKPVLHLLSHGLTVKVGVVLTLHTRQHVEMASPTHDVIEDVPLTRQPVTPPPLCLLFSIIILLRPPPHSPPAPSPCRQTPSLSRDPSDRCRDVVVPSPTGSQARDVV